MKQQLLAFLLALLMIASITPGAMAESGSGSSGDGDSDDSSDDSDIVINTVIETDDSGNDSPRDKMENARRERADARASNSGKGNARDLPKVGELRRDDSDSRERRQKEVREEIRVRTKDLLANAKEVRVEFRENAKERRGEIRERIEDHRGRVQELRVEFRERKTEFKDAKENFREHCAKSNQSDDCKEAKMRLADDGKQYMGNAVEQIQRIIDELKIRIEANEHLSDDIATDAIARLDASAEAVAEAKANVDAIGEGDVNATKEAAEELRLAWSEAKISIRLAHGLLTLANSELFLEHLNNIDERATQARDKLDAEGADVADLDALLVAFRAKVAISQETYDAALDAYVDGMAGVTTNDEASALINDAKEQIRLARDQARDAREDLRSIVSAIRRLNASVFAEFSASVRADAAVQAETSVEADASLDDDGTPDQGSGDVNTESEINAVVEG